MGAGDESKDIKPASPEEILRADTEARRLGELRAQGADGRPLSVDCRGDDPLLVLLQQCHGTDRPSGVRADIFDVRKDRLFAASKK